MGLFENLSERNGQLGNGEWLNFKLVSLVFEIIRPKDVDLSNKIMFYWGLSGFLREFLLPVLLLLIH